MTNSIIKEKSRKFAINTIHLCKTVSDRNKEYIMTKQLLRSGTSIGANVAEGVRGQSKADFCAKMSIALKEASETSYWLDIMHETGFLSHAEYKDANNDCEELIRILVAITKNTKGGDTK